MIKPNIKRYPKNGQQRSLSLNKSNRILPKLLPVVPDPSKNEEKKDVTLSGILEFWLRSKHSQCRNPVLTVPKFSFFKDHKCHESKPKKKIVPMNLVRRHRLRSQMGPTTGSTYGKELDKKFIWSRYKGANSNIRTTQAHHATTCTLNTAENLLVLGKLFYVSLG